MSLTSTKIKTLEQILEKDGFILFKLKCSIQVENHGFKKNSWAGKINNISMINESKIFKNTTKHKMIF